MTDVSSLGCALDQRCGRKRGVSSPSGWNPVSVMPSGSKMLSGTGCTRPRSCHSSGMLLISGRIHTTMLKEFVAMVPTIAALPIFLDLYILFD